VPTVFSVTPSVRAMSWRLSPCASASATCLSRSDSLAWTCWCVFAACSTWPSGIMSMVGCDMTGPRSGSIRMLIA
jgi:hypothetical protein